MSNFVQMEDVVPGGRIARIAAVALVVALVAIGAAYGILRASGGQRAGSPDDAPEAASTIGMLEQSSIEDTRRGLALREQQRAALEDAGVERAIVQMASQYMRARARAERDGGAP